MAKIKYTLVIFSLFVIAARAQTDTVFWFAPPDLEASHQQVPIRFCFTTYEEPSTVTFMQPANSGFTPVTFTIAADSFFIYDVSSMVDIMETKPINTVVNRGVYITSTTPVSCYYESVGNNSEMYTLKGKNALGTDFLVPMQNWLNNNYSSSTSSIELIATEDNTVVQITAPVALRGGIAADSTVTIVLQRGQSYSIRADGTSGLAHLHNTYIHSNKPIAVNTTDDSVYASGCFDLIGDQLVPIPMAGTRYVALRNNSSYERIFIYPIDNQTHVSINGVQQQVLDIGQWLTYELPSSSVVNLIEADNPVIVFQMTAIGCELGGTVLPQIECTGSHKVAHLRPSSSTAIITLLVGTDYVSDFLFNGNPNVITAADFSLVPGESSLSYCVKDVSAYVPEGGMMTIQNEAGRFHLGVMDGTPGGDCSYGFFSDYNSASYIYFDMDSLFCNGGDIVFDYLAPNVSNVVLTCPNGQQLTDPPFVFSNADSSLNGLYYIDGVDTSSCFVSFADSIYIRVVGYPTDTTLSKVILEDSLPYVLNGKSYYQSGINVQHLTNAVGCDSVITLAFTVVPALELSVAVTGDTLCAGDSITLSAVADSIVVLPLIAIGDILCTDGTTEKPANFLASGKTALGVVFFVDSTGAHGWAVHPNDQSEQVRWCSHHSDDVPGVSHHDNFWISGDMPDFDGYANTQYIWAAGDSTSYPAAHTVDFPNGWYLPGVGQLDVLFSEMVILNPSLQLINGTPFPMNTVWNYWSSTQSAEESPWFAWYVASNGRVDYMDKMYDYEYYYGETNSHLRVRSIRNF